MEERGKDLTFSLDLYIHHVLNFESMTSFQEREEEFCFGFRLWNFPLVTLYPTKYLQKYKQIQFYKGKSCVFSLKKEKLLRNLKISPIFCYLFRCAEVGIELVGTSNISLDDIDPDDLFSMKKEMGNQVPGNIISGKFNFFSKKGYEVGIFDIDIRLRFIDERILNENSTTHQILSSNHNGGFLGMKTQTYFLNSFIRNTNNNGKSRNRVEPSATSLSSFNRTNKEESDDDEEEKNHETSHRTKRRNKNPEASSPPILNSSSGPSNKQNKGKNRPFKQVNELSSSMMSSSSGMDQQNLRNVFEVFKDQYNRTADSKTLLKEIMNKNEREIQIIKKILNSNHLDMNTLRNIRPQSTKRRARRTRRKGAKGRRSRSIGKTRRRRRNSFSLSSTTKRRTTPRKNRISTMNGRRKRTNSSHYQTYSGREYKKRLWPYASERKTYLHSSPQLYRKKYPKSSMIDLQNESIFNARPTKEELQRRNERRRNSLATYYKMMNPKEQEYEEYEPNNDPEFIIKNYQRRKRKTNKQNEKKNNKKTVRFNENTLDLDESNISFKKMKIEQKRKEQEQEQKEQQQEQEQEQEKIDQNQQKEEEEMVEEFPQDFDDDVEEIQIQKPGEIEKVGDGIDEEEMKRILMLNQSEDGGMMNSSLEDGGFEEELVDDSIEIRS